MRRFILLTTIVLIVWAILRHAAGMEPLPGYVLRDTLLLLLMAAGASAWVARAEPPPRHTERAWSNAGRALFGAGAMTALVGGLLPRFATGASAYAPIVWGVGIALALLGVLLRGEIVRYAPPPVRWERDADGRIVGKPLTGSDGNKAMDTLGRRGWIALALLLLAATALRLWLALRAPDYCLGSECDLVVTLSAGMPRTTLITQSLAGWLMRWPALLPQWASDPLQALRVAGALVSSLALVALVPALRRVTSAGGVLLGVALAGFGAWAATPWPEAALFVPLVVWGAAAGSNDGGARMWAIAGLAWGLAAVSAPALLGAWLLWLVALLIIGAAQRVRERWVTLAALGLGALAGGALLAGQLPLPTVLPSALPAADDLAARAAALFDAIFAAGALGLGALAVVGAGAALRLQRRGAALLCGTGALLLGLLVLPEGDRLWPQIIAFLLLLAAVGADTLLRAALRAGRPLLHVRTATTAALALLLLLTLSGLWRATNAPQAATDAGSSDMALSIIAYVTGARAPAQASAAQPVLLAPAPLLAQPLLQRALAPEIQAGRVLGYNLQSDIPFAGNAPAGIVYLLAVDDTAAREELWRVYPAGLVAAAEIDPTLPALTTFTVDGPSLAASRGLHQLVASASAGAAEDTANGADLSTSTGALDFSWAAYPPAPPPFVAEWRGSLIVRERGDYGFSVEAAAGALFSLLLDNRLILDTSAGLTSHNDTLAAGAYAMTMRYQNSAPGNLRVLWQPPGLEPAPIPTEALHNPVIPTVGLVGTYSSGALWDGPILTQRKDRVIQADPTLAAPWSVTWQGQLAAPRTGEYLIGAVSDGALLIDVDGQSLVVQMPGSAGEAGYDPAEGTIYLKAGWTPISVRYATGNQEGRAPEIKLYWQPPGSGPAPLNVDLLYPSLTPMSPADVPLPPLPAVVDPRLGDEGFALSSDSSYWLPQTRIPPRDLPALNLERVAQFGVCGSDVTQLNAPHGLAWDAARQTLYVADTANRRVLALTLGEDDTFQPALLALPALEEPVDVAVGPDGMLYVLDTAAPLLVAYDPASAAASTIALPEGFYRPRGLDVDATGLLYIADTGGARVAVIERSTAGEGESVVVQASFGGHGTALGNGQPVDVVAAPQSIWAIAAEQGRLWRLDALGSLTAVKPTDTINGPQITQLDDGRVFVSDPAQRLVLLLSAQGQPLASLGDEGAFQQPTGVAAWQSDGDLLLAVSDTAQCSVSLWRGPLP